MIKRNPTKPVRVVPPMMEEQEVSTTTLQEWLDREETVSHLLFCKGKEEGTNLTKVSKTAPFSIRHSANVNSVPLN